MIEVKGNLWNHPADARVITTNGFVKKDGRAVMGRGIAYEAKQRYPDIDLWLGAMIRREGNIVSPLYWGLGDWGREALVSFPVKHNWWEKADTFLITRSAFQLMSLADLQPSWKIICMPRPGCGNGRLDWVDVKMMIDPILDDRFHVFSF
ncbi:hypothetical protein LCGC14_0311100 [marine sediment metagenome]|uniref:Macro domain-containing protein n=1 Tax=marine sediment metagenome TaxID=412755 RepID=A0A0F9U4V6_9ZZZZ